VEEWKVLVAAEELKEQSSERRKDTK